MIQTARKNQSQECLILAWKTAGLKLGGSDTALGVKICRAQPFPDAAFLAVWTPWSLLRTLDGCEPQPAIAFHPDHEQKVK